MVEEHHSSFGGNRPVLGIAIDQVLKVFGGDGATDVLRIVRSLVV